MTDAELLIWLRPFGKTRDQQASAIIELLQHADTDRMLPTDRVLCRRALDLLRPRFFCIAVQDGVASVSSVNNLTVCH